MLTWRADVPLLVPLDEVPFLPEKEDMAEAPRRGRCW